jgi:hypothetical protein
MTAPTMPAATRRAPGWAPPSAPQPRIEIVPIPAALILDGAANLLDEYGWTQGRPFGVTGRCMENALFTAAQLLGADQHIVDGIVDRLDRRLGVPARRWNDTPGRTQGEVVGLLRDLAIAARAAS